MEVIQTIAINKEEKKAIELALLVIDRASDIAHCSMSNVFDYILENSEFIEDSRYDIDDIWQIIKTWPCQYLILPKYLEYF